MRAEILYPEVADLYGDLGNIRYLEASLEASGEKLEKVETHFGSEPAFLDEKNDIDLVYMGTMTESSQRLIIDELRPHVKEIKARIEAGQRFLITGNALEIFGSHIEDKDPQLLNGRDPVTECLGIFPFHTERKMLHRFNSLYIGDYDPESGKSGPGKDGGVSPAAPEKTPEGTSEETSGAIKIVGFKSQFTQSYYDAALQPLFMTEKGPGFNPDIKEEGIRYRNFCATYIIGPLLVLNPEFTKQLMRDAAGISDPKLAYEEAAQDAYETRLKEYSEPDRGFYY
jgi:CobQ-like glutamine amidotransferase family enzyme